ncbi:RNA polymerase sigma factor [Methyloversatilis thermotolerans]|uniref:RNA polymerase sigma factor n=1 Tax=Methyloversatilis thermotolerans TaxID=1346290 RepID=UPI000361026B|nr:RNA polymerase sigma factor [Methyloversatilis thermotolerans]
MAAGGDLHRTLDAVWRIESARIIGALTRLVRDVGIAEELAQDALVVALEQWPVKGVPDNPGAWLTTTARNRALDLLRHRGMQAAKADALTWEIETQMQDGAPPPPDAGFDNPLGDDVLRLIFITCHPVLSVDAQVALTLKLVAGLSTPDIARAFLVPEATLAQRIVRAKRTLTEARVPFDLPDAAELGRRLDAVLKVIYLIFNEGYAATAGEDWMRPALCEEALRLGRVLAELAPAAAEVHGLVALMEIQASRLHARTDAHGNPVLLLEQNRSRWDRLLIRRGLAALERAAALGGFGPYALQAAIAACHARAARAEDTDWARIAALYDALSQVAPSPVVELNRAVAVGMAFGPQAGLDIADALRDEPALKHYALLPAVRGELLARLGRHAEASAAFRDAAALTRNARERALMEDRTRAEGSKT